MSIFKAFILIQYFVISSYAMNRIIQGKVVKIDDFPYQLSLRIDEEPKCGAVLIASKYALSAAHCFERPGKRYSVRAGSDLKDYGGIIVNVKEFFIPSEHKKHWPQYDIAILELEFALPLNEKIQPVKLPEDYDSLTPGAKGIVSGFGDLYYFSNAGSHFLRAAEISVVDLDICQKLWQSIHTKLTPMQFCAIGPGGNTDACNGDSGGPMVADNVLHGLVSLGNGCGDPAFPGVYTKVSAFREFIRNHTNI